MRKHVLLISFLPPIIGTGSSVILKRHLHQLEREGWKISIVVPEQHLQPTYDFPISWQIIPLISHRWWWPPVRPQIPISLEFRFFIWRLECERAMSNQFPSAILTVLWDIYPLFATHLSSHWNIPLSVIIHDQEELWAKSEAKQRQIRQRSRRVLQQADRIWAVSKELKTTYNLNMDNRTSILLPIPETLNQQFIEWRNNFRQHPVVAHAGSLHPFQISNFCTLARLLEKVNGTLLIIARSDNPTLLEILKTCSNVEHQQPFESNKDAIAFLANRASCILVSYAFLLDKQPWAATSFPSKLVEFSHLGLPILILAPSSTAISRWSLEHNWLSYIDCLDKLQLIEILTKLTNKETWNEMAKQTRKVSLNEFSANLIQAQFEAELATN